jgi:hypothetical protein
MIVPSNGRIVLFHPGEFFQGRQYDKAQPLGAMIVHVFDARTVNLTVMDSTGHPCAAQRVPLLQDDDTPPADGPYAEWMAYQKGQAAKTEALEQKLAGS